MCEMAGRGGGGRTFRGGQERGTEWRVHQITTCIPLCSLPTELMTDCFIGHMNVNSGHIQHATVEVPSRMKQGCR
jgi:hypothetical protein